MNPEQQRIAIAEACGRVQRPDGFWFPEGKNYGSQGIPDYLHDLNAMHEAEKTLTDKAHEEFRLNLYDVIGDDSRLIVSSTAAQRAEAFLCTIGKWEESK